MNSCARAAISVAACQEAGIIDTPSAAEDLRGRIRRLAKTGVFETVLGRFDFVDGLRDDIN